MKYRDDDIVLVKSTTTFKYKDFVPSNDFLFIKLLTDNKIIASYGDIDKKIFNLKKKDIINKNIKNIKIEFFNDYIYNLKEESMETSSTYQFIFQYKDDMSNYSCSVYPCIIMDKLNSFDIIIRKTSNGDKLDFITLL